MTRRLLIDTDTASDDAVALVMALREPAVEVEAITVVAGNVPLDQAVQNALYTTELAGQPEVPIHAGRAQPLTRPLETAQNVHGDDGMGDIGLPLSGREPTSDRGVEVIVETLMGAPGEIVLVTLGPLTNIAEALRLEPLLAGAVQHCFVMGGACAGPGNVTDVAEFNLWADPEAADIVVRSGMPLTFVGWDISVASATFGPDDAAALRTLGPLGEFAVDIQAVLDVYAREESGIAGFDLPDPIAMAVAIDPTIAAYESLFVEVRTGDGPDRGQDIIDWLGDTGRPANVRVTRHVPRQAFVGMLERLLA